MISLGVTLSGCEIYCENDLLRYERSSSTDVLPHCLAAHHERFHNGLTIKINVLGTMVRSKVFNDWCFCLGVIAPATAFHDIRHFITFDIS